MAKPGSDEARELTELAKLARGATIVGGAIPPQLREQLLAQIEGKLGMRCGGCHRRIRVGIQFTKLDVKVGADGKPEADVLRLSACSRDDCDFARDAMDGGATVMEMVEYQWLDDGREAAGPGLDPDAAEREPKNGTG